MTEGAPDFGELRSLLQQAPDPERWSAICALLERWPAEELEASALPYALAHLERWPEFMRAAPWSWVQRAILGAELPCYQVVRALDLRLHQLRDDQFARLAVSPLLEPVCHLYLSGFKCDQARLQMLVRGQLQRLEVLYLDRCGVGDRGLEVLARWPGLRHHVRELGLEQCWLTRDGLAALADSEPTQLHTLDLGGNPIDAAALTRLASAPLRLQLQELSLDWCHGRRALIPALCVEPDWPALRVLDLEGLELQAPQLEQLSEWPGLAGVRWLKLGWCNPGAAGLLALAHSAYATSLRVLDLRRVMLPAPARAMLAEQLPHARLLWDGL
jgi:hypothetical protein